jgi:two-component sensor histidine kinase
MANLTQTLAPPPSTAISSWENEGGASGTDLFAGIEDGRGLARAMVDTVREPLLVLDKDLRVVAASRAFYQTFKVEPQDTQGRLVYDLGDGQWNIPELRLLLETILPQRAVMEAYEVEHDFAGVGRRTMLLNAREVFNQGNTRSLILLAIQDVSERRTIERSLAELLQQKGILLQEMQHRVANSLQIIASILSLKARKVQSEETRLHLQDAQQRVMSVAAVQQHIYGSEFGGRIELAPYLTRLCETLAASMIGESRAITLQVQAEGGTATSAEAASIGLIVTELVINALKHAFVGDAAAGRIVVAYEVAETNWKLSVSDNGIGNANAGSEKTKPGLGTSIVEALAKHLDAHVEIATTPDGTSVSITHGKLQSQVSAAA